MADNTCAHEPCDCKVGGDEGIENERGERFCSEGCANREGCVCAACGCKMATTDGESSPAPGL